MNKFNYAKRRNCHPINKKIPRFEKQKKKEFSFWETKSYPGNKTKQGVKRRVEYLPCGKLNHNTACLVEAVFMSSAVTAIYPNKTKKAQKIKFNMHVCKKKH
jgi:hypothetical protein